MRRMSRPDVVYRVPMWAPLTPRGQAAALLELAAHFRRLSVERQRVADSYAQQDRQGAARFHREDAQDAANKARKAAWEARACRKGTFGGGLNRLLIPTGFARLP